VVPCPFSGTFSKIENKIFYFYFYFYLYISLITTKDFCKVPYSESIESQENFKANRSTTSIKMQGDLHPHELVILVLTDSSVNIFGDHTGE
jgi:hypothetical protein